MLQLCKYVGHHVSYSMRSILRAASLASFTAAPSRWSSARTHLGQVAAGLKGLSTLSYVTAWHPSTRGAQTKGKRQHAPEESNGD